jgi:hypothetical protein
MPADDLAAAVFRSSMRAAIRGTPDVSTAMAVATPVKPGKEEGRDARKTN